MLRAVVLLVLFKTSIGSPSTFIQYVVCNTSDPSYDQCTLARLRSLYDILLVPNPPYGLPSLNPLLIESFNVSTNVLPVAKVSFTFSNVNITGLNTLKFLLFKSNLRKLNFVLSGSIDFLNFDADFSSTIKIFGVPNGEKGHVIGLFEKINATLNLTLKNVTVSGTTYLKAKCAKVNINIGTGNIQMTPKMPVVQGAVNSMQVLEPILNKKLSKLAKNATNTILSQATADQWLPK